MKLVDGTCSLTNAETDPWWSLDLGFTTTIQEIYIANRDDAIGDQLKDFEIRIGDSKEGHGAFNKPCGDKHTIDRGAFSTIVCNNTGRYIHVRLPGDNKKLSLCEVIPYGMGKI